MIETNFPLKSIDRIEAIKAWWLAFSENSENLDKKFAPHSEFEFDVFEFMQANFAAIHPDMNWEYGPSDEKEHLLAVAPERDRALDPLGRLILSMAPKSEKFEFRLNRPHTEWEVYKGYSDGRLNWDGADGIMFTVQKGKQHMFNLIFHVPPEKYTEKIYDHCFVTCETLLGEETMVKWIHYFDVEKLPKKSFLSKLSNKVTEENHPLSELREVLATEIAKVKNTLLDIPYNELSEDAMWSVMSMEPDEKDHYEPMSDLITAVTPAPDLFDAYYAGRGRFYSERFSKFGEQFLFVQLDGTADDLNQEIFEDRGAIEDAIENSLKEDGIGKVIGGGTGRRYSYISISTVNLERAVPKIRAALQLGKITRRSWILFHDTNREQEWIGIWDDTPEPNLPNIDT